MKSPFTGGSVKKISKTETFTFRNEEFKVRRSYFKCIDTGKTFSNADVDGKVMEDLYAQYRERHGIPSPGELRNLREKYGLSAHIMSKIAGIGINQYGLYENGEMPTIVIGKRLASLFDKASLLRNIDSAQEKLGREYEKVREKVENFAEPASYHIENRFYIDFQQIIPLARHSATFSIKRPQWAAYGK